MLHHSALSPVQFIEHADVGRLKALDFKGHVGDPDPVGRMEDWQAKFGGTKEARHYDEGDSPTAAVERLREDIRANGVTQPIQVNHWKASGYMSIADGHHRAVAAYLEGQGVPAHIKVHENI